MKHTKRTISLLLALCLICLLGAFGPGEAVAANEEKPSFEGSWKIYSQEGSKTTTHEEILEMQNQGYDLPNNYVLTLKEGGVVSMFYFGNVLEYDWTDNGDGTGAITLIVGNYPMSLRDGFLVIHTGTFDNLFERSDRTAEELGGIGGPIVPEVEDGGTASDLPSPSEAVPLPYTLENGVQIDELSVSHSGQSWYFGYAVTNTTKEMQTFQLKHFSLKTADGKTIRTAAAFVSDDELRPGVTRRGNGKIMDDSLLHLGDQVYYFYGDVFLGVVTAKEF